jgi:hypothetical protein
VSDEQSDEARSESNVYIHGTLQVINLTYVDDLMIFGLDSDIKTMVSQLKDEFLISECGDLNDDGSTLKCLGRKLTRDGGSIHLNETDQYYQNILNELHLSSCKAANEPSPNQTTSSTIDLDDSLNDNEHSLYRRIVGKLQGVVVIRPDLAFTVKELARASTAPTQRDLKRLIHCVRYLKGTLHLRITLQPQFMLDDTQGSHPYDIQIYTDANWAGCGLTRKSTSGVLVHLLGVTVAFSSKTQATHAIPSAESAL